jgi:hypothetical protein
MTQPERLAVVALSILALDIVVTIIACRSPAPPRPPLSATPLIHVGPIATYTPKPTQTPTPGGTPVKGVLGTTAADDGRRRYTPPTVTIGTPRPPAILPITGGRP